MLVAIDHVINRREYTVAIYPPSYMIGTKLTSGRWVIQGMDKALVTC